MAEDLAIDVGLEHGTDEYRTFVKHVQNILTNGCRDSGCRSDIIEKCQTSELDIAKDVIDRCRSAPGKWWQTYTSKAVTPSRQTTRPMDMFQEQRHQRSKQGYQRKRPMSPLFQQRRQREGRQREGRQQREGGQREGGQRYEQRHQRPMDMFRRQQQRPMSPQFRRQQQRPMSPLFRRQQRPQQDSDVPHWPESPRRSRKRRRRT